jgi:hypothetical protein
MKKIHLIFSLLLWVSFFAYASVTIKYFTISPVGTEIKLQWEAQSETGITEFQLWKRTPSSGAVKIHSIIPNGNKVYAYTDANVMKTNETQQTYIYTLRVMQGSAYTDFTQTINHNPTSIQRTWGSIKSMFK